MCFLMDNVSTSNDHHAKTQVALQEIQDLPKNLYNSSENCHLGS